MKKIKAIAALMLVLVLVLTGCGGGGGSSNTAEAQTQPAEQTQQQETQQTQPAEQTQQQETQQTQPSEQTQQQETQQQETQQTQPSEQTQQQETQQTQPAEQTQQPQEQQPHTQSYQDSLLDKIPLSIDLGVGWEFRDLTVNGVYRRITVTFEMDADDIQKDPCFAYYRADVIGEGMYAETVAVGREFFTDFITEYVRSEEPDMIQMELFEYDFKAATLKGADKDYIVFSLPAGWEPDTSIMVIATGEGKLLADFTGSKTANVKLQGDGAEKYTDYYGNTNFLSVNGDEITYLQVSQKVDGVTYLKEYTITIDSDKVTSVETGKTFTTKDNVPDLSGMEIRN